MTYSKAGGKFYAALTDISAGMLKQHSTYDLGGPNHIKVAANKCGCVMELDVDQSTMRLTKARMLVCGKPLTDAGSLMKIGDYDNSCDPNGIASPDNVNVIQPYNQVCHGAIRFCTAPILTTVCAEYVVLEDTSCSFGFAVASHRRGHVHSLQQHHLGPRHRFSRQFE